MKDHPSFNPLPVKGLVLMVMVLLATSSQEMSQGEDPNTSKVQKKAIY